MNCMCVCGCVYISVREDTVVSVYFDSNFNIASKLNLKSATVSRDYRNFRLRLLNRTAMERWKREGEKKLK